MRFQDGQTLTGVRCEAVRDVGQSASQLPENGADDRPAVIGADPIFRAEPRNQAPCAILNRNRYDSA